MKTLILAAAAIGLAGAAAAQNLPNTTATQPVPPPATTAPPTGPDATTSNTDTFDAGAPNERSAPLNRPTTPQANGAIDPDSSPDHAKHQKRPR